MRVLIQRVAEAAVTVGGAEVSRIGAGLLLFAGIEEADGDEDIEWLVGKVARLRIFDDEGGVMNLDITRAGSGRGEGDNSTVGGPTGGEALVISQFTLHASTRKGNRPSYIRAARPEIAEPIYEKFVARLSREIGREVKTGVFGADMKVSLINDGPVTIWIDSRNKE
jgi:D-tyrosyl-tRNA(Tyr) deacylase